MAELWFDDMPALLAARQSPEWKAASEDEKNFVDGARVAYFVSEEHVIADAGQSSGLSSQSSGKAVNIHNRP
jgi:hypothetical protein